MKKSVEEQQELIPDEEVKRVFLERGDIAGLSSSEKEERWVKHKIHLDKFRVFLSDIECIELDFMVTAETGITIVKHSDD
jgi:hypothetical protein